MSVRGKAIVVAVLVTLASLILNFGTFILSYNRLATPFLAEEQRVSNANIIMGATLPTFSLIAIAAGIAIYFAMRK
jgi:hypothetical protein